MIFMHLHVGVLQLLNVAGIDLTRAEPVDQNVPRLPRLARSSANASANCLPMVPFQ